MFCPNCGNNVENARFCNACGTQLAENANPPAAPKQQVNPVNPVNPPMQTRPVMPPVQTNPVNPNAQAAFVNPGGVQQNQPVFPGQTASGQKTYVSPQTSSKIKKKIIILVVAAAVVLVIAALCILLAFSGGLSKSSPLNTTFEAAKKTVFESSGFSFDLSRIAKGNLYLGKSYKDSSVYCDIDDGDGIAVYDGSLALYDDYYDEYVETSLDELAAYAIDLAGDFAQVDVDLTKLISGHKINEQYIKDLYNTQAIPALKKLYKEEAGIDNAFLPEYDELMAAITDFLNNGLTEEAVKVTESKADNGKRYLISVNIKEFMLCMMTFSKEDKTFSSMETQFTRIGDADLSKIEQELEDEYGDDTVTIDSVVSSKGYLAALSVSVEEDQDDSETLFSLTLNDINTTEYSDEYMARIRSSYEREDAKEWLY